VEEVNGIEAEGAQYSGGLGAGMAGVAVDDNLSVSGQGVDGAVLGDIAEGYVDGTGDMAQGIVFRLAASSSLSRRKRSSALMFQELPEFRYALTAA
jgi:hypothetical protein